MVYLICSFFIIMAFEFIHLPTFWWIPEHNIYVLDESILFFNYLPERFLQLKPSVNGNQQFNA